MRVVHSLPSMRGVAHSAPLLAHSSSRRKLRCALSVHAKGCANRLAPCAEAHALPNASDYRLRLAQARWL